MWEATKTGDTISMVKGEYGLALPFLFKGLPIAAEDRIQFTFKKSKDSEILLTKEFTNIQRRIVNLVFTKNDSDLFDVGTYYYRIDWYQPEVFNGNLIHDGTLKVVG